MASLVLGVAGAVVGSFFGAPQIGWMIGSAIGGALDPQVTKSEGPRIGDAQITSSTLGTPMMVLEGTSRISGNVIQASKVREVAKTETQGKGGPSAESTTYSYNADIAIDLCEGPALGIRKIWTDGKLTYDISADVDAASGIASTTGATGFKFYAGTEDQMPDPTLEAITGVGATPAYRGRAYVVFAEINCRGGRIPQLTFEVVCDGVETFSVSAFAPYSGGNFVIAKDTVVEFTSPDVRTLQVKKLGVGYVEYSRTHSVPWEEEWAGQSSFVPCISSSSGSATPEFYVLQGQSLGEFSVQNKVRSINLDTGAQLLLATFATGFDFIPAANYIGAPAAHDASSEIFSAGSVIDGYYGRSYPGGTLLWEVVGAAAIAARDGVIYHYDGDPGITMRTSAGAVLGVIPVPPGGIQASLFAPADESGLYLMMSMGVGGTSIYRYEDSAWMELVAGVPNGSNESTFYANQSYAIVGPAGIGEPLTDSYRLIRYNALEAVAPLVRDIIADQCARSGIPSDRLSFVGVDDTVPGYPVTRVSSGRANIQPLQTAFFIDAAEIDLKLVFTKRAAAALAPLIPYDELAASEDGSAAGDPFPLVRAQEEEFPRSVTASFIDINSDYQPGAESSRREVTKSINDVSSAIPICTTSDHAKQVAEVLLFDAWNGRNKRSGTLTRKYAYLTSGDVVPIEYPAGSVQQWILTRVSDTGLLIEFEAVEANAALYQVAPAGSTAGSGQVVTPLPAPTNLALLDIPILRDADDNAGMYVPLSAAGPTWRGATLWVGKDDTTMEADGGVSTSSPIGFAANALGDWSMTTVDETNVLSVSMGIHALASTTRDAMLNDGVNTCVIGAPGRWEICQFMRAVSLGEGRYQLSGFVRGIRGTEQNRATHQVGDTFVLLVAAGIRRPQFDIGELNQVRRFRAVAAGREFSQAASFDGVNTGAGLKPLPPVNLRGVAMAEGYTKFTWDRRTRISSNWLAGVMPLGESVESYAVELRSAAGDLLATGLVDTPVYDFSAGFAATAAAPANAVSFMQRIGGEYFGSVAQTQDLYGQKKIYRLAPDGTLVQSSADLGNLALSVEYSPSSVYVVTSDVVANHMVNSKIHRLDLATLAVAVTVTVSSTNNDVQSVAFDGTNLWAACAVSGDLVKRDGTTLAVLATTAIPRPTYITYSSGFLYILCRFDGKLIKWNCATNTQVWQTSVDSGPWEVLEVNGLLVVTAPSSIAVYDSGTGGFLAYPTKEVVPLDATYARNVYVSGDKVLILCSQLSETRSTGLTVQKLTPAVVILSATTGELQRVVGIDPLTNRASGVDGDRLITSTLATSGPYGFAVNTLSAVVAGNVFTVYQISASVGRGFPATITL